LVDIQSQLWTHFPEAREVVVRRHFVQTQFLVVIRANPLGCVNGAFFQGLVNLATRNVLGHNTQRFQNLAAETAHAEFQALHVGQRFDLFAIPAAHLNACVAHREVNNTYLGVELTEKLQAVAFVHPSVHLACVQTKWNGAIHSVCRIFTEEVVRRCVAHLNGAVGHAVEHTKCRHQFASSVGGDGELAARHFANLFSKYVANTEQCVE